MELNKESTHKFIQILDFGILLFGLFTFCYWFTGEGLLYSVDSPVLSPFTSLSLVVMVTTRIASRNLSTWSKPMSLALLGVVACGNFSSLWIQLAFPELFLKTMPGIVPTSALTSLGIIAFCFYETLQVIRKTPESGFILDDILLHLALVPGGLSFLGYVLGIKAYMSSSVDPRVGVGVLEMLLMGSYALVALLSNPDLFLWRFLRKSRLNVIVFLILFLNQFIAPIIVGLLLRNSEQGTFQYGIEFFVMLAGIMATLIFLVANAFTFKND